MARKSWPVCHLVVASSIAVLLSSATAGAGDRQVPALDDFQLRTTVGLRYWYSESSFDVELEANTGHDLSRLKFGDVQNHTLEAFFRVEDLATDTFFKGTLGIGRNSGGFLDDEDYTSTGLKFSDTTSELDPRSIQHVTLDAGWQFANDPKGRTRAGVFFGYQYISEDYMAKGARCNPDQVGGLICGAPGTMVIPANGYAIRNEVDWHLMRLGLEASFEVVDRLTISGELAAVPFIVYQNQDSHYLRFDVGPVPNFVDRDDKGYGIEAEAFVNYAVNDNLSIGLGGRYWQLHTKDTLAISGAQLPFIFQGVSRSHNNYTRYGVLGEIAYKF